MLRLTAQRIQTMVVTAMTAAAITTGGFATFPAQAKTLICKVVQACMIAAGAKNCTDYLLCPGGSVWRLVRVPKA